MIRRLGALVSVFPAGATAAAADRRTDQVIVAAARWADPRVVVFDPIAQGRHFPRIADHLHPTPAEHRWVAAGLSGR
jgi:acyl-CoA thioesterase I